MIYEAGEPQPGSFLEKDRFNVRGLKGKDLNPCGVYNPEQQNGVLAN
jgi:hypothetical protein